MSHLKPAEKRALDEEHVKPSSLFEKLVVLSTELGGLQKRLRSIENVISGIDARADDTPRVFTDRDRALIIWCYSSRASLIETRSRIESILAKLERLSGRSMR